MKESDLYSPIKQYLEYQNYEVKGEIHDCDVIAIRGDEPPVIIELKLSLNLDLVLQAVDRLSISPKVYIAVPCNNSAFLKKRKRVIKLLRMLGLGLMTVNTFNGCKKKIDVILDPVEYKPRQSKRRKERLLAEFTHRVGDPNSGGIQKKRGLMTAYRQRAVSIAQFLLSKGPSKAAHISSTVGDPKARELLYKNVYGWFERESRGIYMISPRGEKELLYWLEDKSGCE